MKKKLTDKIKKLAIELIDEHWTTQEERMQVSVEFLALALVQSDFDKIFKEVEIQNKKENN